MRPERHWPVLAVLRSLSVLALGGLAMRAHAATPAKCAGLASFNLEGGVINDARLVADPRSYCRVTITLTPTNDSSIRAELWLPAPEHWNGKFQGIGNGGYGGSIAQGSAAMVVGLQAGESLFALAIRTSPAK